MKNATLNLVTEKLKRFLDLFLEEIDYYKKNVINEDIIGFKKYYNNFLNSSQSKRQFFFNRYIKRLYPFVNLIFNFKNGTPKIIDAGCGFGTESIILAYLGAEVIGFDLRTQRIEFAKRRVKFYESKLETPLKVTFKNVNIFSEFATVQKQFDFILAFESISHIDPAEDFLKLSHRILKKSGIIVISETNPLNPFAFLHFFKEHIKYGRQTTMIDPNTKKQISYAIEREFRINKLCNLLKIYGFTISNMYPIGFVSGIKFIPNFISDLLKIDNKILPFESYIEKIPFIRQFAQIYTIISIKT